MGPTGLAGDGHRSPEHGGTERAVCLLSVEETRLLEAEGVPPQGPGGYAENLLVAGLDFESLRPGDQLVLSADAQAPVWLELTNVRAPCARLKQIDPRFPDLMLGRSGFLARVLRGGTLEPGMNVAPGEYKAP
ncbi:MAG: MOSC domain-containing protein [Planctomycetes bacterium]|nr:MOSC domain-containing protein [Planctomycetota bacterium]